MGKRVTIQDPIDGTYFEGGEYDTSLLLRLSKQYQLTVREVYLMARVLLFGPRAIDLDWDPFGEWDELDLELRRDRARLLNRPSIDELVEIWQRNRDSVAKIAARQTDPGKRAKLERLLEERDATMAALLARA